MWARRDGKCTFEVLIEDHDRDSDPALVRLAKIVHAADIADDLGTDPGGPGLLAIGLGGLDVEADDHRLLERGPLSTTHSAPGASARYPPQHERHRRLRRAARQHPPPSRPADGRPGMYQVPPWLL